MPIDRRQEPDPPRSTSCLPSSTLNRTCSAISGPRNSDDTHGGGIVYDLLNFSNSKKRTWDKFLNWKKRTRDKVEQLAISASGRKVAVLTLNQFWVFSTHRGSLVCTGQFREEVVFKYGQNDEAMMPQYPIPEKLRQVGLTSAAMNDEYLAIGVAGKVSAFILVFTLSGEHRGRWVFRHKINAAPVKSLQFSPDGAQLLALVRVPADGIHYEKLLVYRCMEFPRHNPAYSVPVSPQPFEIRWEAVPNRTSRNMVFSRNGILVAICTNVSGSRADIRVLSKFRDSQWVNCGVQPVQVFSPHDSRDGNGRGLTGISLYLSTKIDPNVVFKTMNV